MEQQEAYHDARLCHLAPHTTGSGAASYSGSIWSEPTDQQTVRKTRQLASWFFHPAGYPEQLDGTISAPPAAAASFDASLLHRPSTGFTALLLYVAGNDGLLSEHFPSVDLLPTPSSVSWIYYNQLSVSSLRCLASTTEVCTILPHTK